MTTEMTKNNDQQWRDLWTLPDDEAPDLDVLHNRFEERSHRERRKERLEYLAILLGVLLTVGLLITSPLSATLVVLVLFCWVIWGISIWMQRSAAKTTKELQTRPPSEFVQTMRESSEARRRWIQLGNYLLVAVGVFAVVWTSWMISANWDTYLQDPWRGVGGIIVLFLLAIFLHRKEITRLNDDIAGLEEVEQRLTADDPDSL